MADKSSWLDLASQYKLIVTQEQANVSHHDSLTLKDLKGWPSKTKKWAEAQLLEISDPSPI